jgi:ribulose-phosphate 3-epimerase
VSDVSADGSGSRQPALIEPARGTQPAGDAASGPERPPPLVLPALLLCDFGHLSREVSSLQDAGARGLHLDVMDGRFVPQLTYGPVVVRAVRQASRVPIEVHLMIEQPERTVAEYLELGPDVVTVHIEGVRDAGEILAAIRAAGCEAHLAVSPGTPIDVIRPHLDACDGVLVMGVEPGFGGQPFLPATIHRLEALREMRRSGGHPFSIGVDGGISDRTIARAAAAGAERFVAGSAVIRSGDYASAIAKLETLAREAA